MKEKTGSDKPGKYKLKEVCVRLTEGHPLYSEVPVSSPEAALEVMRKELSQYDREILQRYLHDIADPDRHESENNAHCSQKSICRQLLGARTSGSVCKGLYIHNKNSFPASAYLKTLR